MPQAKHDWNSTLLTLTPVLDGLLIALSGWTAYRIRWDSWQLPQDYLFVLVLGTAVAVVILPLSGAYQSWRGSAHWYAAVYALPGLVMTTVIMLVLGTLTKTSADFSRLWMGYWFLNSLAALFTLRWLLVRALFDGERSTKRIIIIGDGEFAANVAHRLHEGGHKTFEVVGFISVTAPAAAELPGPCIGRVDELESVVSTVEDEVDELWVAVSDPASEHRSTIVDTLRASCLTVRVVPDLSMLPLLNHLPSEIAGMTVINLNASPLDGPNAILKSVFDKLFSTLALVMMAPVMAIIALWIKLDSPGPVLFSQERHGWDGKIIRVLKFRTMRLDPAAIDGSTQAVRNDPRVTTSGRFLRRTSLDELPQFINVLTGDMSVVGPRPHPVALNQDYVSRIDAFMQRHRVKPGITGWAQVHGFRGETNTLEKMEKRVEYDLYYIENWSLWLDIQIILRTLVGGWTGEHAY